MLLCVFIGRYWCWKNDFRRLKHRFLQLYHPVFLTVPTSNWSELYTLKRPGVLIRLYTHTWLSIPQNHPKMNSCVRTTRATSLKSERTTLCECVSMQTLLDDVTGNTTRNCKRMHFHSNTRGDKPLNYNMMQACTL